MLKLSGAILVMLGAGWCGAYAVSRLRWRVRTLSALRSGLAWLEEELAFHLTPLPALLERLGRELPGAAGFFFSDVLHSLRRDPEGGLRKSWRQAMVRQLDELQEEDRQVLLEVGQSLGRYDAKAQCQVLRQAAARLESLQERAQEESKRLSRVYTVLSLAAGAAVVLMLA